MLWRYGRAKSTLNSVVLNNDQGWLQIIEIQHHLDLSFPCPHIIVQVSKLIRLKLTSPDYDLSHTLIFNYVILNFYLSLKLIPEWLLIDLFTEVSFAVLQKLINFLKLWQKLLWK